MGEICDHFERTLQQHREKCITEKCSCSRCDSLSCFEKRNPHKPCSCGNCDRSESCSYYKNISVSNAKLSRSEQYAANYLRSPKPVTDRNVDEFIEDMIYEADRRTILGANPPPPTTIQDYAKKFLTEKIPSEITNKSTSLNEYIDKISRKNIVERQKYSVKLKDMKPLATPLQQFETTSYSSSQKPLEATKTCTNETCTRKHKVENRRNYESDRKLVIEANQQQPLNDYIDKMSQNSHYKAKLNVIDSYVYQLKHAKHSEPFENIFHNPNESHSASQTCSHQIKQQQHTLDDYITQFKHPKHPEPSENIVHYPTENNSTSQKCSHKINQNALDTYINQFKHAKHSELSENILNYQQQQHTLDDYITQFKHPKHPEPSENVVHYPNENYNASRNSHKMNALANYINQFKHPKHSEPFENKVHYPNENYSVSQDSNKIKQHTLDDYITEFKHPKNLEPFENTVPNYPKENYSASPNSYKMKPSALENYINQFKHPKHSEPFENVVHYPNENYSASQNSYKIKQNALDNYIHQFKHETNFPQKTKQNALDNYINQFKHAKPVESFDNSKHYSNRNYSASESPKKRKRSCHGQCKKSKCSHTQSVKVSCPVMSFTQSISKISNAGVNATVSCKELCENKNYFDIFKKLIEIYKVCSCKVCECIGPKVIRNEVCTCKPCGCPECARSIAAMNCTNQNCNQSKTHIPREHSRICNRSDCPVYQNKETKMPPCECAGRQREMMPKAACLCPQRDRSEHLHTDHRRKCTVVSDDNCVYNRQCIPTRDPGCCYVDSRKKNNGKNTIAMYTSVPPIYPNFYSYNTQSATCDCKQCDCIQCKGTTASIIKSSYFGSTMGHTTSDVCACKPCDCYECTRYLTKYKFEQLHQAAFKPSNSSIYSSYDKSSFYPYRCSLCRSEFCFSDDFVSVRPDIESMHIKKGDILTPAAYRAKVQRLMLKQEKSKLMKTFSAHKNDILPKVSNNVRSQCDFYNYQPYKNNYRDSSTFTQTKKDISTALTQSFYRWAISQCDAGIQSVELTKTKPELKNISTNKTTASYTSVFSSTETVSKLSLLKENVNAPPFTANSNKSSVSSCYSSGPNHCGYVIQFPKSAVATCIEGVLKSGLENDLQLYKFNFDPSKQTNILGNRTVYQASDDENVTGASTSTSADAKYSERAPYYKMNNRGSQKRSSDEITRDNNNIENNNNAINVNSNVVKSLALKSDDPYGINNNLLTKPHTTSSDSSNFNNSIFRKKTHDECFHMIQSFNQINFTQYLNKCNGNEKKNLANNDEVSNFDDYYERVRKTLKDSKEYTSHLQELVKMYEKENNEFVRISDRLKSTYESVYNKFKHGNVLVINRHMPALQELPSQEPNFGNNEHISIEITRDRNYDMPVSHVLERNHLSNTILNQEPTNVREIEDNIFEYSRDICFSARNNERSNKEPSNILIEEITDTTNEGFIPAVENVDASYQEEVISLADYTVKPETDRILDYEDVKSKNKDENEEKFDCCMPCSANKGENVRYIAPKETMTSTSFQTSSAGTPKRKLSYKENKALKQLQNNVRKLVDLAILHSLNRIDDDSSAIDSSSDISSMSKLDLDSEFSKQFSQPNVQVNKEVWCDNLQLMKELKRQIKDHLKTACMHPLLKSQQSSECMDNMSVSSRSSCESKKVRYLMVQKISEHTALLKWSQPRELSNVEGYELLVDGRAVQKIFNPSKCMAAVTCLPHSDKILLTIRTLTSAVSEAGHYPASTIIYRPRVK